MRRFAYLLSFCPLLLVLLVPEMSWAARRIQTLPSGVRVNSMALGPDGNMWVVNAAIGDRTVPLNIGRITPDGSVKFFATSTRVTSPHIARAGDRGLAVSWSSAQQRGSSVFIGGGVGLVSVDGTFTDFTTLNIFGTALIYPLSGIEVAPDGTLWFGGIGEVGALRTLPTTGTGETPTIRTDMTGYGYHANEPFANVAVDKVGRAWFVGGGGRIGTAQALVDEFGNLDVAIHVVRRGGAGAVYSDPIFGPDGRLWFKAYDHTNTQGAAGNYVGRYDPRTRQLRLFGVDSVPPGNSNLIVGPDQRIWWGAVRPGNCKCSAPVLVRSTTSGRRRVFPIDDRITPWFLAAAPNRQIWVADGRRILKFSVPAR